MAAFGAHMESCKDVVALFIPLVVSTMCPFPVTHCGLSIILQELLAVARSRCRSGCSFWFVAGGRFELVFPLGAHRESYRELIVILQRWYKGVLKVLSSFSGSTSEGAGAYSLNSNGSRAGILLQVYRVLIEESWLGKHMVLQYGWMKSERRRVVQRFSLVRVDPR